MNMTGQNIYLINMITAFLEINMFPNEIIRNVGGNYVCKTLSQKKKNHLQTTKMLPNRNPVT